MESFKVVNYNRDQHLFLFSEVKQVLFFIECRVNEPSGHGEVLFTCPFCNHVKPKLAVNVITTKWKCWVCGKKGNNLYSLFRALNRDITVKCKNYVNLVNNRFKQNIHNSNTQIATTVQQPLELPKDFISALKHAESVAYLEKRGITEDLIYEFNIGYSDNMRRVVIPSYNSNNKLNYYIARDITGYSTLAYLNPKTSKNIIFFENKINWNLPITLCEGVFDAITIKYNAIPILGNTINDSLKLKLLNNNCSVNIMLDSDAYDKAYKIYTELLSLGLMDVCIIKMTSKDSNELGHIGSWNLIENNKEIISETDMFQNKILRMIK